MTSVSKVHQCTTGRVGKELGRMKKRAKVVIGRNKELRNATDGGDFSHKPTRSKIEDDGSSSRESDRKTAEMGMVMVRLRSELLRCPVCFLPLVDNSPVYQCNVGHVLCDSCRKKLVKHCPSCDAFTVYRRCIFLQNIVESATVCCVNSSYGCQELLSLDEKNAHEEACMHFRCFCPKKYCIFMGSKEMLVGHLVVEHNITVEKFSYNLNFNVDIRRLTKLKVLLSYDDKSVFILQTIQQEQGIAVSCVCVRPPNFLTPAFSCSLRVLKATKHVGDSDIEFKCRIASTIFQDGGRNDQFSLLVPFEIFPSVGTLKLEICIKEV